MNSTREFYSRLSGRERQVDLQLRKTVRAAIREQHGPDEQPPGRGWLYGRFGAECIFCDGDLFDVLVPGYEATAIFFCPQCGWCQTAVAGGKHHLEIAQQLGCSLV